MCHGGGFAWSCFMAWYKKRCYNQPWIHMSLLWEVYLPITMNIVQYVCHKGPFFLGVMLWSERMIKSLKMKVLFQIFVGTCTCHMLKVHATWSYLRSLFLIICCFLGAIYALLWIGYERPLVSRKKSQNVVAIGKRLHCRGNDL